MISLMIYQQPHGKTNCYGVQVLGPGLAYSQGGLSLTSDPVREARRLLNRGFAGRISRAQAEAFIARHWPQGVQS